MHASPRTRVLTRARTALAQVQCLPPGRYHRLAAAYQSDLMQLATASQRDATAADTTTARLTWVEGAGWSADEAAMWEKEVRACVRRPCCLICGWLCMCIGSDKQEPRPIHPHNPLDPKL